MVERLPFGNSNLTKDVNVIVKVIKRIVKILLVGMCILAVVCAISYINRPRPLCSQVTVEGIKRAVATVGHYKSILVGYNERAYRLPPSNDFGKLFEFDEWEPLQERIYGTSVIAFNLADEWVIDLYSDGKVCAYYGYSPDGYKSTAYYVVPIEIINALSDFVEENGELQELYHAHAFYHP